MRNYQLWWYPQLFSWSWWCTEYSRWVGEGRNSGNQ